VAHVAALDDSAETRPDRAEPESWIADARFVGIAMPEVVVGPGGTYTKPPSPSRPLAFAADYPDHPEENGEMAADCKRVATVSRRG
jgi:hypothetical protein